MSFFGIARFPWLFWLRTIFLGVFFGLLLIQGDHWLESPSPHSKEEVINAPASLTFREFIPHSSQIHTNASYLFQEALLKNPPVEEVPIPLQPIRPLKPTAPKLPFYEKYVPVPKKVSPNSVRLAKVQAPLPISAKKVNGQWVCANKKDKGRKSDQNKRAHIDRQCCLDPDEVPNPHCTY